MGGSYSEEDLKKALSEVKDGASLKSTSKKYGISPQALRRHRGHKALKPGSVGLGRHRPDINKEYEDELVLKIQAMEMALFGLTSKDVFRRFCRRKSLSIDLLMKANCQALTGFFFFSV